MILEMAEDCADIVYCNIWDSGRRQEALSKLNAISTLTELIMDQGADLRRTQTREIVYRKIEKAIRDYCKI